MKRIAAPIRFRWKSATMLVAASLFGLAAFLWPLTTNATGDENLAHSTDAPWLFVIILPLLLGVLLAELSEGGLDAKAIAMLGVLVACGALLRAPVTGVTGFTGVFFLIVLGGRVFGRGFGFVQGATTMFASALLTGGVGPWLPFQMLGSAWVGLLAGSLPPMRGRREVAMLAAYAALSGLIYGLVMDMWFWPFTTSGANELHFVPGASVVENLQRFWAFHLTTALGFDVARAAGNAALIFVVGTPVLAALRRASRRAAFEAPVIFLDDRPSPEFERASVLPTP